MSPKAATRTRAQPAERRRQIVSAATQLIGERGYQGFTIRELAERCGLTDAGLLHHFGSKEQLLTAVLDDRDRRDAEVVTARLRVRPAGESLTRQEVRELLQATVARNCTQPELVRLFVVLRAEALSPEHPAHGYFLERQASSLDMFTAAVSPHVAEPRSFARHLIATMEGLEQQWLQSRQAFDLVAEWNLAMERLLPLPAP